MKKKVSKKMLFAWPTRAVSVGIGSAFLGYVTYFATDYMEISAVTAGIIFMLSKIFDGFTDLVGGYLVDHTHTKLGKARPYELALIGYWISLVLLFAAPKMGATASCIYLFVMYSRVNAVFLTLLSCSDSVYLANSLDDPGQNVSVVSVNGFVTMIFSMAAAIAMPQVVKYFCTSRAEWAIVAVILAIPCTLVGLIRFFVVKERQDIANTSQQISLKEAAMLLKNNKYILIFTVVLLFANIGTASSQAVGTYFNQYILKDIGIGSLLSLSMVSVLVATVVTPGLARKFGFTKVMKMSSLIGVIGFLIRLIDVDNILLLFISSLLSAIGPYLVYLFAGTFVIDCMDYGEWKNGVRSEGTISCVSGFTSKVGTALGAAVASVLMGLAGYNGALAVQTDAANMMIILLNSVVPAIFCLVQYIFLRKYDLDTQLPEIRAELEKRRSERA